MAKQKFDRSKPHMNVGTIGHIDHGKTTLTAAITLVLHHRGVGNTSTPHSTDRQGSRRERARHHDRHFAPGVRDREPPLRARRLPGRRRLYQEHDHRRRSDGRRDPGRRRDDGPMPQTREHVLLARQVNVPNIIVFLNKVDMIEESERAEMLELVEMEIRELLNKYEFPGNEIPSSRDRLSRR